MRLDHLLSKERKLKIIKWSIDLGNFLRNQSQYCLFTGVEQIDCVELVLGTLLGPEGTAENAKPLDLIRRRNHHLM